MTDLEGFQGQGPEVVIPLEKKTNSAPTSASTPESSPEEIHGTDGGSSDASGSVIAVVASATNEGFRGAGPEAVFVSSVSADSRVATEVEFRGAGPEDTTLPVRHHVKQLGGGLGFEEQDYASNAHLDMPRPVEASFEDTALLVAKSTILFLIGCIAMSWFRYRKAISYIYAPVSSSDLEITGNQRSEKKKEKET
mmetsp:Transcript_3266/g.6485  ORF Transcript_3266/g.6485 Transcript_3266/m.6485 type:complete len:195 (+) Transcript_3266:93-677(+)